MQLSWVFCVGSHKAAVRVSVSTHSYLEVWLGKNLLPSSLTMSVQARPSNCLGNTRAVKKSYSCEQTCHTWSSLFSVPFPLHSKMADNKLDT